MTETDDGAHPDGGGSAPPNNLNDPEGFITSPPSTLVKVINTARADINGQIGVVLSYNRDRARYTVSLLPGQSAASAAGNAAAARAAAAGGAQPSVLSFKVENLARATAMERAKAHAYVAYDRLRRTINDPLVREQMRRTYTSMQNRLPAGVKPEYVGVAFLSFYVASIWTFGFAKTLMATSLVGMVLAVSLQDILAGSDAKTIARNFPRRFREAIVQSTGFERITERQAMAAFVVVFLLSATAIVTPTPKKAKKPSTPAAATSTGGGAVPPEPPSHQSRSLKPPSFDSEEIYKLGFNDAKEGKEYGASLPDPVEAAVPVAGARGVDPDIDPLEWDLNPPPRPEKKESKFGFATIMAAFALFRLGKEIAINPNGQFDQQMAMANLRLMPPWKLGIVAFCLYRVVSVFF